MTYYDYHVTMSERSSTSNRVRVAQFKARLSEYLRRVRRGQSLTLLSRDTPIAVVVPWDQTPPALPVRLPLRRLREVALPTEPIPGVDSLAALKEERQSER